MKTTVTRRRYRAVAAAAVVACVSASNAAAQPPPGLGQFQVSPSRQFSIGTPPTALPALEVENTTRTPFEVTVEPVELRQNLSGTFTFTPGAGRRVRNVLRASVSSFTAPTGGSRRSIALRWIRLPKGRAKAVAVGIAVTGTDATVDADFGARAQILAVRFLQVRTKLKPRGRITRLEPQQAPGGRLLFNTRARNVGRVFGDPRRATLTVRNEAGKRVAQARWSRDKNDFVVPRAVVEFPAYVTKTLGAGLYSARSRMRFGNGNWSSRTVKFRLTGPNELPAPQLAIGAFEITRAEDGGPIEFDLEVRNDGTAPGDVTSKLALTNLEKAAVVIARSTPGGTAPAGESVQLRDDLGDAEEGEKYRLYAEVFSDGRLIGRTEAEFDGQARRSVWERFTEWLKSHKTIVAVILLALLALVAFVLARRRARQADTPSPTEVAPAASALPAKPQPQEDPLAPAPTAAALPPVPPTPEPPTPPPPTPEPEEVVPPTPAPSSDAININTASADELLKLPGVGRKAAERIVAHRDEYGAFASLDDLADVEGFDDPARVRRLAQRATV